MTDKTRKPSKAEIELAVGKLTMLRFFPAEPITRAGIMELLDRMVGTVEQLDWLTRTMIDQVGEWKGPMELRGVFCTRFKPADGVEAWSSIAGFTASDSEAAYSQEHPKLNGRDVKALPSASEIKALPLPPEEIEANQDVVDLVRSEARHLARTRGLLREEKYEAPQWLKDLGV